MNTALFLLLFAPAPTLRPAKPAPPPAIVPASVVMTWSGVDCETHFHADGFYSCQWAGRWWHGRWSQAGGVLSVEEWPIDAPLHRATWRVRLRCPASGVLDGGSPWRLTSMAGRVR